MLLGTLAFFIATSLGLLLQLDRQHRELEAERAAHRACSRRCNELEQMARRPPYRAPQLSTRSGYVVEQWATGRWAAKQLDGFTYIGGHGCALDALRALIEIEEAAQRPN